jgi:uncharacterized protein (TIGR02996 family)
MSADRAAFLRAIADNPDDDLPRLVFADWLDEHGEPERAEFIRVQCELAGMTANDPRRLALTVRQNELWSAHRDRWLPSIPVGIQVSPFQRGFLAELQGAFSRFELCAELAVDHPIQRLSVFVSPREVRRLVRGSWLRCVNHLHLEAGRIGNIGITALVRSEYAHRLRTLRISGHVVGDVGVQALAEAAALAELRSLDLSRNRITDVGAEALAATSHLNKLAELDLRVNQIRRDGRALLRARYGDAVKL